MIYTLVTEQAAFGVDRDFRRILMDGVPVDIATVQFDTDRNTGVIDYRHDATVSTQVRDFEAEHQAELDAKAANKDLSKLEPIYKTVEVPKPRRVISSFQPFLELITRWELAKPILPPPPPVIPPEQRIPLIEVIRLLRQKGVFTQADIDFLKTTVRS